MFRIGKSALNPILILRLGLGLTFVYAGASSLSNPSSWIGYVPEWTGFIAPAGTLLALHGVFELLIGLALAAGFYLPAASLVAFLDIGLILVLYGVDDVTFRDFGLLMSSLALFILSKNR
ncbi:MAG TPA: DoxX family membrane protein [Candidatus Paceibacterota bacterium]|nr:DoxX family membrane protein [Candidatus Paceibacterota bacterium]